MGAVVEIEDDTLRGIVDGSDDNMPRSQHHTPLFCASWLARGAPRWGIGVVDLRPRPRCDRDRAARRYLRRTNCPCFHHFTECNAMHARRQIVVLFVEDVMTFIGKLKGAEADDEAFAAVL